MRESLRAHLRDAVRAGRYGTLLRAAVRSQAARFGLPLPRALRGPVLATFAITYRCPLACAMCDLPSRARDEIPDEEVPRWIAAISALRPAGLGFTGGEPMLRRKALLPAIEQAAALGMVVHLNTSGLGIDEATARRLAASGLASVNVSIDHDVAEEHDRLRGRQGSHETALRALRLLRAAREEQRAELRLQAVMAVSETSLERVGILRRQVLEHGADALSLLPVHDFDGSAAAAGLEAGDPEPGDGSDLVAAGLENSEAYLRGIPPFLRGASTGGPCSAPRTALFVDPRGRVYPCTPSATVREEGIAATPETLGEVVRGGALGEVVPEGMCERCWWNCHRELDIAIGRR